MIPNTVEGFALLALAALIAGFCWTIGAKIAGRIWP